MKKLYSYLMAFIMINVLSLGFVSCGSDDDETTYTLIWNTVSTGIEDVTLFEYTENGDRIANNRVDNISQNGSYMFIANERTAKVKVYFKMLNHVRWVQQVFYLKPGSNIDIEVNDETLIGTKEP